jgi:hypothetical protein
MRAAARPIRSDAAVEAVGPHALQLIQILILHPEV